MSAGQGHNSKQQLKSIIERVESLEEEKRQTAADIKDVYAEAKANGYDVPALRAIVKMRREDFEKRRAHEAVVETYMHALGMLADLPLGQSAIERAAPTPAKLPDVDTSSAAFHPPPDDEPRVADQN